MVYPRVRRYSRALAILLVCCPATLRMSGVTMSSPSGRNPYEENQQISLPILRIAVQCPTSSSALAVKKRKRVGKRSRISDS